MDADREALRSLLVLTDRRPFAQAFSAILLSSLDLALLRTDCSVHLPIFSLFSILPQSDPLSDLMSPPSRLRRPVHSNRSDPPSSSFKTASKVPSARRSRRIRRRDRASSKLDPGVAAVQVPWPLQSNGSQSLRRFVENCQARNVTEFMESLYPMLGLSMIPIPFRAQYRILQTLQRRLEFCSFRFVHRWLPLQSLAVGWTCPEALELHRVFKFVTKHRSKISCEEVWKNIGSLQDLRNSVASIRHAAVHRLPQDRDSLLQMNRAAVKFCLCMDDGPETQSLCRLFWFLQEILPKSSVVSMPTERTQSQQIQQATPAPHKRRNTQPSGFFDGRARLIGCVEMVFVAEVDRFLQTELL
ncbi:hypothetical protein N7450_011484 [Penicillium hetheringtonii]|uniref:Uncharacterized protein n=1 Tax=Penicillium hetheringtonii TaxID=911720 RepID=A0AAD6GLX1_9EURO|nr:hypothetical protein N7450_011484 [Penicillium hetheringtonii]